MKKHSTLLFLFGILTFSPVNNSYAKEELTVIQTVSKDRRSFVVAKGIKDGVMKGQEIIFANDNVSVVCKAAEVNRDFSLWVPVDRTVTIPFNKEDIVSSNSTVYGNVALEIASDPGLTPDINYNEVYKKFRAQNNWAIKASYNKGLTQSSSSVADEKNSSRSGYNVTLEYNYRFLPEFEMSFGARMDNEVYRIENPELDIPTRRIMGTVAATYHFVTFSDNKNNFYLTVAAGLGKSETTVDDDKSSGRVTLLPEARLGYMMPFSKNLAMVFEGAVESLSSTETFSDGTEQTTNILNFRATIGLRF
nr:outer membrane protein beta-barrel domain protein [Bacteriovorax sp. HI3]